MVEFFNTVNTCTISRNGQMLLYPFPLVVKIEATDKDNGKIRALSFNYFNDDSEVNNFVEEMNDTYGLVILDNR